MAKKFLGDVAYIPVDAEENPDLCRKYKVLTAPTLVVEDGGSIEKYENLSAIRKYLNGINE